MFAEVLIEYPTKKIDKYFTYKVPNNLLDIINVGMKVKVPFGTKIINGFVMKLKDIYNEQGMLSLEQIEDFVNYPGFAKICNEKLNDITGESIGHYLVDIQIEPKDYKQLLKMNNIIQRLQESGYDFSSRDDFGRTSLLKAIEAENIEILNFLLDCTPKKTILQDMNKINEMMKSSNNQKLKDLMSGLK